MRTIRLTVRYDGGEFFGWQRQPGFATVQAALEDALAGVSGSIAVVHGSGRTDSGVHALAQVAHVRLETRLDDSALVRALNAHLPEGVGVVSARTMPAGFHARKSAIGKRYVYLIRNHPVRDPIARRFAWWLRRPLDHRRMSAAARHLRGKHDFRSFQTTGSSVKTSVRTVRSIHVRRRGARLAVAVEADGFLYNMVRTIVGTLVEVGRGALDPEAVAGILAAVDRRRAGPTAPPHGLYLWKVLYPPEFRVDLIPPRYEKQDMTRDWRHGRSSDGHPVQPADSKDLLSAPEGSGGLRNSTDPASPSRSTSPGGPRAPRASDPAAGMSLHEKGPLGAEGESI